MAYFQILDNSASSGYVEVGTWSFPTQVAGYGPNSYGDGKQRQATAGTGSKTATWTVSGVPQGSYDVYATWANPGGLTGLATNAPFAVFDGTTSVASVAVNQSSAPADLTIWGVKWKKLGTVTIASGTCKVQLTDNANGTVLADAIRIHTTGQSSYSDTYPPGSTLYPGYFFTPDATYQSSTFWNLDTVNHLLRMSTQMSLSGTATLGDQSYGPYPTVTAKIRPDAWVTGGNSNSRIGVVIFTATGGSAVSLFVQDDGTLRLGVLGTAVPSITSPVTIVASSWYWFKLQAYMDATNGLSARGRIWADGSTEPSTWQMTGTVNLGANSLSSDDPCGVLTGNSGSFNAVTRPISVASFAVTQQTGGTGTASLTTTHPTIAATGTIPVYHGNATLSATHATIAATATVPIPQYHGNAALTATHATVAATGTTPVYHGNATLSATHVTIAATGHFTPPVFTGTASLTAGHPTIAATATLPTYHGNASLTASHATIAATAQFVAPVYHGNATLAAHHATIAATAHFAVPVYHGNASLSATHVTLSATATFPIYRGNAALSSSHATISATATFPIYHGNAALVASHASIAATATSPTYHGNASLVASHASIAATANFTAPIYHGNASLAASHAAIAATSTFTVPVYHGNASLSASHAAISATAHFAAPVYHGNASLAVHHATIAATAHFTAPVYHGNASLSASHAAISATARFAAPVYHGNATLATAHVTLSAAATFPIYRGNASLPIGHPTLSATATSPIPVYHGNTAARHGKLITAGWGGSLGLIMMGGFGRSAAGPGGLVRRPMMAATGTRTVTVYGGNASLTIDHPSLAATGTFFVPAYHGNAALVAGHPTLAASGSAAVPVYHGNTASRHGKLITHGRGGGLGLIMLKGFGGAYAGPGGLIRRPVIAATGTAPLPTYTGRADACHGKLITHGRGGSLGLIMLKGFGPAASGPCGLITRPTIAATGTCLAVFYGHAFLTVDHPTVVGLGVFSTGAAIVQRRQITTAVRETFFVRGRARYVQPIADVVTLHPVLEPVGSPCQFNPNFQATPT